MNQLQHPQFQVKSLLLAIVQVVEGAQDNLQVAGNLFFREEQRRACCAGALVAGNLQQLGFRAAQLGHQRIAQVAGHMPRQ